MYKVPDYIEPDQEKVLDFMKQNSFVLLSGSDNNMPVATQIPVEIEITEEGKINLFGHMMRGTDHFKAFEKNDKVLTIFTGPHCYVSASWYTNPHGGSTWNYISVHAIGKISFMDDDGTFDMVRSITKKYEADSEKPSLVEDMPEEYLKRNIKGIRGFRIEVTELKNVFKLSQDKDQISQQNVIRKLQERNDHNSTLIAEAMQSRLNETAKNIEP